MNDSLLSSREGTTNITRSCMHAIVNNTKNGLPHDLFSNIIYIKMYIVYVIKLGFHFSQYTTSSLKHLMQISFPF